MTKNQKTWSTYQKPANQMEMPTIMLIALFTAIVSVNLIKLFLN